MNKHILVIPSDANGQRLDRFISQKLPQLNFTAVQKLCRKGEVKLNGKRAKKGEVRLEAGGTVEVYAHLLEPEHGGMETPDVLSREHRAVLEDALIFEDEHLLVLNKPFGIASQGGTKQKTSLDKLLRLWLEPKGREPRLVHRLDQHTTGCFLVALDAPTARALSTQFKFRGVEKTYWAVCEGSVRQKTGDITAPLLKRGKAGEQKMEVHSNGAQAVTHYEILGRDKRHNLSWVQASPMTGRTHQIRVHLAHIGLPIAGDMKYGKPATHREKNAFAKLCLHARALQFVHPILGRGREILVRAPLPSHMQEIFESAGWEGA